MESLLASDFPACHACPQNLTLYFLTPELDGVERNVRIRNIYSYLLIIPHISPPNALSSVLNKPKLAHQPTLYSCVQGARVISFEEFRSSEQEPAYNLLCMCWEKKREQEC